MDLVDCRGDVAFESVDFAYGADGPLVLSGFDLHLAPGETVALVGRTGSGKSTVARLLARFYDVRAGSVRVDGHDVRDLTLESLRSHIGIVLDEPFLFSGLIRDNIAYGDPTADFADVEAAAVAAGADEFIRELPDGYDTVVGERGYTLSGGQRQRIAIARTLLVNPPILVLDDATSAIDVQVELAIHASLRGLMKGRTTLIIAHRLSTIGLADRVVLLDGGRVVADGTHAELLATTPLYAEVLAQVEAEAAEEADPGGWARDRTGGGRGERLMAWGGGGFGPPMGGGGRPGAPVGGLPFAGIPSELQAGVDQLLAEEPDHGEPTVRFSQLRSADERRRLTLWRLLTEHPSMLAGAAVLVVVIALVTQVGPKLTEYAITHGMAPGHHDMAVVALMAALYAVSVGITALSQRWQVKITGRLAAAVMNDLRVKVFAHIQRLSLDYFTDEKAGVIMTRMTSDIENLQQLLQDGLSQFAIQGLTMVVITVILFTTNARLAFITVVMVVPVLVGMSLWFRSASERGYDRVRDGIANVMTDLSESLHGIRIVTAFNRQRHNVAEPPQHRGRVPRRQRLHRPHQRRLRAGHPTGRRAGPGGAAGHRRQHGAPPHADHRRPGGLLLVPEPVLRADPAPRPAVQLLPAGPGLDRQAPDVARDRAERARGAGRRRAPGHRRGDRLRAPDLRLRPRHPGPRRRGPAHRAR